MTEEQTEQRAVGASGKPLEYVSPAQFAHRFSRVYGITIGPDQVRRWCEEGLLPALRRKVGGEGPARWLIQYHEGVQAIHRSAEANVAEGLPEADEGDGE